MVTAFAPVNIAWVKYMGKKSDGPTNSSLSMTLDSLGTRTRIEKVAEGTALSFDFHGSPYMPPASGKEKIHRFLSSIELFENALHEFGFHCEFRPGTYRIHTLNNVPAGTGIASSASGFAALTLAWAGFLAGKRAKEWVRGYPKEPAIPIRMAQIARAGSGSACRSFHGPFVEWTMNNEIVPFEHKSHGFVDFILLFEVESKAVSSSDAHQRVVSSPRFSQRADSVAKRLQRIKEGLQNMDHPTLARDVREEALEMHELFHTSVPPFRYLNPDSEFWLSGSALRDSPFSNGIVTADAGANIHVFIQEAEALGFDSYLKSNFPGVRYLISKAGSGAFYDSEGV
jgi:diphosphomevalonate decarboxylase